MKKISDLIPVECDIVVEGITDDSRLVQPNYIFVATKGFHVDHFDYIQDAIEHGCCFIICDRPISFTFPHYIVDNTHDFFIELCKKYYDIDMNCFHFIGITGTDGKTTTTSIVSELLDRCAYIGTNGVQIADRNYSSNNTTPCIEELYHDLYQIQNSDFHTIAMEVSSEALLHNRVDGFLYDVVGFTNITGDHLNIHPSFENYISCKKKLLDYLKTDGVVVYNGDDPFLQTIVSPHKISFGFHLDNDYVIQNYECFPRKTIIKLSLGEDVWEIHSPFVGEYNVYNVVMAFIIGRLFHIDDCLLLDKIKKLRPIKGRGEFLDFGQDFDVVLDYAHTVNGIRSVLDTFQHYDWIITVTGSAGGREVEKRSVIGKIVLDKSDVAIFTMDDPRFEDVDDIIDQMVGDATGYYRIVDREDAISFALSIAPPKSVVLILGKGRDNYMAIGNKKIHYNDYNVISNYFKEE